METKTIQAQLCERDVTIGDGLAQTKPPGHSIGCARLAEKASPSELASGAMSLFLPYWSSSVGFDCLPAVLPLARALTISAS